MRPVHIALAVLVAAIWGMNFVVIEVGLEDFPPLLLSALRYTLAALPLLVWRGGAGVPWRWVLAVGVAIGVVKFSLLFVGMDIGMPAGLASLVLQVQAFFTVGFAAVLLGERLRVAQAAGLVLATAGLVLVASGLDGVATPGGFALVIGAAAAWGIGNIAIKRAAPPDPLRFMTWICVVPPLPLFALSLASRARSRSATRSPGSTSAASPPSPTSRSRPPRSAGACGRTCCARTRPAPSHRSRCWSRSSASASRRCCSASR